MSSLPLLALLAAMIAAAGWDAIRDHRSRWRQLGIRRKVK